MKFFLSYYGITVLFSVICGFIALFIGLKLKNKFAALNIFYLYPLASVLQSAISLIIHSTHNRFNIKSYISITNAATNIFLLAEFLLIYNFFQKALLSKSIKQVMRLITAVYVIILITDWFFYKDFFNWSTQILVVQAIFMLVPALYYFFDLLINPAIPELLKTYSFWISLGVVFYFSCTLPIFLFKDFAYNKKGLLTEANLYSINTICYGIFFLLIAKAYLCPKKDTP